MVSEPNPSPPASGQPTSTGLSFAAGLAVTVAAALLAAAVFPPTEPPGRMLVMAGAAGVFASVVADLRVVAAVAGVGMSTFVRFLTNQFGGAWSYAVAIGFAGALGSGYRLMRSLPGSEGQQPNPAAGYCPVTFNRDSVSSPQGTPGGHSREA